MTAPAQLSLARYCPRCGSAIPLDEDLAARATRGLVGVRDRKLVVPASVLEDLAVVAQALRCKAELCIPQSPRAA